MPRRVLVGPALIVHTNHEMSCTCNCTLPGIFPWRVTGLLNERRPGCAHHYTRSSRRGAGRHPASHGKAPSTVRQAAPGQTGQTAEGLFSEGLFLISAAARPRALPASRAPGSHTTSPPLHFASGRGTRVRMARVHAPTIPQQKRGKSKQKIMLTRRPIRDSNSGPCTERLERSLGLQADTVEGLGDAAP